MAARLPSPPPSPPALDDWMSVVLDSSGELEMRSHTSTPAPHASTMAFAHELDELHGQTFDGPHSPESEHMADRVLAQPFTMSHQATATLDAVRAAMRSLDDIGSEEEEMAEAIRSLQQLSQEGSLEGFADEPVPSRAASSSGASHSEGAGDKLLSLRTWLEGMWAEYAGDLAAELADVGTVLRAAGERLVGAASVLRETAATAGENVAHAVVQAVRSLHPVTALSASTVVALCGCAYFVARCRALSSRMISHEKELARMVLKMMNLQDALATPRGPPSSLLLHHGSHHIFLPAML